MKFLLSFVVFSVVLWASKAEKKDDDEGGCKKQFHKMMKLTCEMGENGEMPQCVTDVLQMSFENCEDKEQRHKNMDEMKKKMRDATKEQKDEMKECMHEISKTVMDKMRENDETINEECFKKHHFKEEKKDEE